MRSHGVVVFAPLFDHDLGLLEREEDYAFEQFVPEAGIEAFDIKANIFVVLASPPMSGYEFASSDRAHNGNSWG